MSLNRIIVVIAVLIVALFFVSPAFRSIDRDGFNLEAFGRLPLVYNGRAMPYSAFSRSLLRELSGKSSVKEHDMTSVEWFLDYISGVEREKSYRVIRIVDPNLIENLGLKPRKGYLYSISEIIPSFHGIISDAQEAEAKMKREEPLDVYESNLVDFYSKVRKYSVIRESFSWPDASSIEELEQVKSSYSYLENYRLPHSVPYRQGWKSLFHSRLDGLEMSLNGRDKTSHYAETFHDVIHGYGSSDREGFNTAVDELHNSIMEVKGSVSPGKLKAENIYVKVSPDFRASMLYLVVFIAGMLYILFDKEWILLSARSAIMALLVIHTIAIIMRIYISGRPPVTNLYSSAVFIGWGFVLAGVIIDLAFRGYYGLLVSSAGGFLTQLIAYYLSLEGDTFTVLQAVLDTNFWLATHVVAVTLGYTATFLAGLLGIITIIEIIIGRRGAEALKRLHSMTYGTVCFALFFSFIGTVLGGLWADDSWGRFWGWDPKENGALMIVLWNALVLHSKWGGLVRERGLAVLVVAGNIITSWSWFGTNSLGIGLHSYGQQGATIKALIVFVVTQLVLIIIGVIANSRAKNTASG